MSVMLKIAVVDRHDEDAKLLKNILDQYQQQQKQSMIVECFSNGKIFAANYKPSYDIAFIDMDAQMEGFEAAKQIFSLDKELCIIFTAQQAQYAIRGYEVNALDYVLKPVTYPVIADKMDKAQRLLRGKCKSEIVLTRENGAVRLAVDDIYYIEVLSHDLIYHTPYGSYKVRGKMKDAEEQLRPYGFSRCNNGYLVHLLYVMKIENDTVQVAEQRLPVSRGRKKGFLEDFLSYLGGRSI